MLLRILALVALLAVSACGGHDPHATVARVLDGDTIVLEDGRRVRLVQLDAPETDERECFADRAKTILYRLIPPGTDVDIETDPALDRVDEFGRTLAYVKRDGTNVNLELVRRGAAAPWFFDGDRGRYAHDLLEAALEARKGHLGLWGACPGARFDALHAVEAGR